MLSANAQPHHPRRCMQACVHCKQGVRAHEQSYARAEGLLHARCQAAFDGIEGSRAAVRAEVEAEAEAETADEAPAAVEMTDVKVQV
jgi:hypothetical protein